MKDSFNTPSRVYAKGIGDAVADRTINRKKDDGTVENWADVAYRVSKGNALLDPAGYEQNFDSMHHHMRKATLLMSGRHLQHGDESQPSRNQEVFTNCATSAMRSLTFYLLLNGSGVGEDFSDEMMVVDLRNMPILVPVIDSNHPDVITGEIDIMTRHLAEHVYADKTVELIEVEDSREGWAKVVEKIEWMTYQGDMRNHVLIMDFSKVREKGSPIGGMQKRPASGPGPLIGALKNIAGLRDANMEPWRSNMYASHFLSECVLVGGARRAARMATKTWHDESVLDFIAVKKGGFLWSANNSVTVDEEFWGYVDKVEACISSYKNTDAFMSTYEYLIDKGLITKLEAHAHKVFEAICSHSYHDGTGEPGIINVDKLVWNDKGIDKLMDGEYAESRKFKLNRETIDLTKAIVKAFKSLKYKVITNPCGEIVLSILGGYCVIADIVPYFASTDQEAEEAFRVATRALMRVNLMDSLYNKEVKRTNRIGVGMTGIHEYAWNRFGYGWKELVDENRSKDFWMMLSRFARAVSEEAEIYARILDVETPQTDRTIKPAGTTSKLFGLTEGAHLPSMREYIRWVQFRNDDPLIETYREQGYPIKKLTTYSGTTVIGFPTQPEICKLGMENIVTAAEATPEEQYKWLELLEKYWIKGVDEAGNALSKDTGNQVSYTLKYDPDTVSYDSFRQTIKDKQRNIRACSVMPQIDSTAFEYQPEQPVSKHEFEKIANSINELQYEDVSQEHIDCDSGACPIDFNQSARAA